MTLAEFFEVVFVKHRAVFASVLLATFAAVAIVTFALPKQYDSTATLFVGENRPAATGSNSVPLDEVLAQTYRDLLGAPAISQKVARKTHISSDQLSSKVGFSIATGTHLIKITATDGNPARAADVANVYAQTFVADRQGAASQNDRQQLGTLRRDVDRLTAEIAQLRGSGRTGDVARVLAAQNQLSVDRDTITTITQNDVLQGSNVSIASPAFAPATAARPKPKLYLTIGAALALLLAIGAALLAHALDRRVREPGEVEQLLAAPLIASVPAARGGDVRADALVREPIEFLRMNLMMLSEPERPLRVLAVAGATPGEGKTVVCAALAESLVRAGASVVAVDADVRRPNLAATLGASPQERGLTNVLADDSDARALLQQSPSGTHVLAAGPSPANPTLYFNRARLARIVDDLRGVADYVLIDTAPILSAAETSVACALADGVVVVVDMRKSESRLLTAARDQLAKANARIVGIVLNRIPRRMQVYGYGDYGAEPNGKPPARRRRAGKSVA